MTWKKLGVVVLIVSSLLPFAANAQDAIPVSFLVNTVAIKTPNGTGSSFVVSHHGKIYYITAGHVVVGLPPADTTIEVLQGGVWKNLHIVKVLHPPSDKADIAVLKTDLDGKQLEAIPLDDDKDTGITLGQPVWFLGYPSTELLHSYFEGHKELAFVKRGSVSAIDPRDEGAVILYIDGINNKGFSGGPIVLFDFSKHEYKIIGVVRGYKAENAQQIVGGQPVDTNFLVNSGILVGYSIHHAVEAMEQDDKESSASKAPYVQRSAHHVTATA